MEIDAGFDLTFIEYNPVSLKPNKSAMLQTDLGFITKDGESNLVYSHPGWNLRKGIIATGEYQVEDFGSCYIEIQNVSDKECTIEPGYRVAQAVYTAGSHIEFPMHSTIDCLVEPGQTTVIMVQGYWELSLGQFGIITGTHVVPGVINQECTEGIFLRIRNNSDKPYQIKANEEVFVLKVHRMTRGIIRFGSSNDFSYC